MRTVVPRQCFTVCAASAGAGCRRHGDYDHGHLVPAAALRVEAGELSGGSHVLGKKTDSSGVFAKAGECQDVFVLAAGRVSRDRDWRPHLGDFLRQVWQKKCESHICLILGFFCALY